MSRPTHPSAWLFAAVACIAAVLGVAAVWATVGLLVGHAAGWMALIAAIDAIVLLRLFGVRPGPAAAIVAVLVTLATAVLANWLMAAAVIGRMMGVAVLESAQRLGPDLAWALARLANGNSGLAWLLLAAAVAAAGAGLSGRRRGP